MAVQNSVVDRHVNTALQDEEMQLVFFDSHIFVYS